jgi:hypothetical protein
MLFSSSFISVSIIVDYTPQNIRQQLIIEIMTIKETSDGFRLCQISTSLVKSYGVLSIPASKALVPADAQIELIKIERCCSSGTGTETDSATSSDDSNEMFEVQDNSMNGDQDNVLTRMDITTGNMTNEAIDLGISGNMSALRDMEFSELSKLVSDSGYMLTSIECVFKLLKNTACLYAA